MSQQLSRDHVIFVGIGGNTGRLDDIVRLCRERGLRLILDAAHMSGTRLHGRHVGAEGDVSVFSFHAVKNLPTADSGMICFPDAGSDAAVRHGNSVMADLGLVSLNYLEADNICRRQLAA